MFDGVHARLDGGPRTRRAVGVRGDVNAPAVGFVHERVHLRLREGGRIGVGAGGGHPAGRHELDESRTLLDLLADRLPALGRAVHHSTEVVAVTARDGDRPAVGDRSRAGNVPACDGLRQHHVEVASTHRSDASDAGFEGDAGILGLGQHQLGVAHRHHVGDAGLAGQREVDVGVHQSRHHRLAREVVARLVGFGVGVADRLDATRVGVELHGRVLVYVTRPVHQASVPQNHQ